MKVEMLRKSELGWEVLELIQRIEQLEALCNDLQIRCEELDAGKADRRGRKPKLDD